jgi:hypothetical protein
LSLQNLERGSKRADMNAMQESPTDVVALLDAAAPLRRGTLLRSARRQRSQTRHYVAGQVGGTARALRRCERGDPSVPPDFITSLVECYGEDLNAQISIREPIRLDQRRLIVGSEEIALQSNDADEVLSAYVTIVARLRGAKLGAPMGLRANDLMALSVALGNDSARIETRIVELLDCTAREARSLHSELRHRKLVGPVAGLVTGLAVVAAVGCAGASPSTSPDNASRDKQPATETTSATPHTAISVRPTSTTDPQTKVQTAAVLPLTASPAPPTTTTGATQIGSALTERAPVTQAPVPVSATTGVRSAAVGSRPVITSDTTPMKSLPYGPITIIQK